MYHHYKEKTTIFKITTATLYTDMEYCVMFQKNIGCCHFIQKMPNK